MSRSSPVSPERRRVRLGRVLLLVGLAAAWQLASRLVGESVFASLPDVAVRIGELAASGVLFRDIGVTLLEALAGLAIGTSLGVGFAIALWRWSRLDAAFAPYLTAAMGVPKLALAPIAIVWFGVGFPSKLVFVTTVVFFLMLFGTRAGLGSIAPTVLTTARTLGAKRWLLTREVLLPGAAPFVVATLRIAAPHAIGAAVMGELVASDSGIGHAIQASSAVADMVGIVAGVAVVTVLVVGLSAVLDRALPHDVASR